MVVTNADNLQHDYSPITKFVGIQGIDHHCSFLVIYHEKSNNAFNYLSEARSWFIKARLFEYPLLRSYTAFCFLWKILQQISQLHNNSQINVANKKRLMEQKTSHRKSQAKNLRSLKRGMNWFVNCHCILNCANQFYHKLRGSLVLALRHAPSFKISRQLSKGVSWNATAFSRVR